MFTNDSASQKEGFLNGETRNPHFEYSKLADLSHIDKSIKNLEYAKNQACLMEPSPIFREAIASSLDFRRAEMEYVKLAGKLTRLASLEAPTEEINQTAEQMRQLGHELYGQPDPEIRDMALNELWSILDSKKYHPSAQKLYDELINGSVDENGQNMPLMRSENKDARLPRFEGNNALNWAGEQIIEQNSDIQALINEYWDQAVTEHGDSYECHPEDIVEVFQRVIDMRDPEGESGVSVRLAEGKTALSWESPEMAVLVGSKRASVKNQDDLFKKVLHEFGVHGQRSINGLKTELPVLGTGLFTDTTRSDYLTFEEGLATTVEETIGDSDPQWSAIKLGHYINISMAESGADFRSVFENAWRYRVLTNLKDDQPLDDAIINKHKNTAYGACVRIFRGTQPDLMQRHAEISNIKPLTFNKDLAYLSGRVLAMQHLQELYDNQDQEGVKLLFAGKYDPTIPEQNAIMKQALNMI